jgi:SAM-dependent methyltransferase
MNIKDQYSQIAIEFSKTRYKKWNCVNNFLSNVKSTDKILELGCGNGKNIIDFKDQSIGVDICPEFCRICKNKGLHVIESDILNVNFTNESFDYILCVAVIHHFKNEEDKIKLLNIINNLLKKGGKALITCWTTDEIAYNFSHGDNFVKFNKTLRYYYIFSPNELSNLCKKIYNNIENYNECYNEIVIINK